MDEALAADFNHIEQSSTPKRITKSTRFLNNAIWRYFSFDSNSGTAVCLIDNCRCKIRSKQPSNLICHIKGVHKNKSDVILNDIDGKNNTRRGTKRKADAPILKIKMHEVDILRSTIGMVCEDLIPFTFMNSANFRPRL
ncbi:uncharacterized protein LOC134836415 [Culicoides brevitarsis]|uniref:uncharacterized protein LOC134836415 n=1 Tax=Culicoides brevitarsis TaxID=469753 RepID=UPI00307BDCA1